MNKTREPTGMTKASIRKCMSLVILWLTHCDRCHSIVEESKHKEQSRTLPERRTVPFPLLDSLFPNNSLDLAWERYPLHVMNTDPNEAQTCWSPDSDGGSCEDNDSSGSHSNSENVSSTQLRQVQSSMFHSFTSIACTDDIDGILSASDDLVHGVGRDYSLVKKVLRDGDDWNASPKFESFQLDEIHSLFNDLGFTLIINDMQNRKTSVKKISDYLNFEFGSRTVNSNLYLTPFGTYGFEQHFDYHDVIVVQISGRKKWSIANHPLVYLPTHDMKRKPSIMETQFYMSAGNHSTIILQPGDILYIPRGFVHNATTELTAGQKGFDEPSLPSLHLTFGIHLDCDASAQTLLHLAVEKFFSQSESSEKSDQQVMRILMHYAISEVGRSGCDDGLPEEDRRCLLRQSLSLNNGWDEVRRIRKIYGITNDTELFHNILGAFQQFANFSKTITFIKLIHREKTSTFCMPSVVPSDVHRIVHDNFEMFIEEAIYMNSTISFDEVVSKVVSFANEMPIENFTHPIRDNGKYVYN